MKQWAKITLCAVGLSLAGCQSAYYSAMEKVGIHKREILVDRVEDARDAQAESQEEFKSAYERLVELTNFDGGELASVYQALNDDYLDSKASADNVSKKIDDVEDVAEALFDEWEDELEQYQNANLRADSERKLKQTQRHFKKLLKSMRKAESKMAPILATLNDNVLYLKHNLNAAAISAIQNEFNALKSEISGLIKEMGNAIEESNQFIVTLSRS
ncbi:DUF2959 domain-containing protein [Flocculibacter collagenilyticus]|uniref:DUF2959 domain-containing protein n=1 Tax=Flocculibacter collagenilyticus TaxID=2744479 RepID=UPI0018F6ADBB|nr:DUF2959 domain-containing protein [Flocculibacter collagenilyticus]